MTDVTNGDYGDYGTWLTWLMVTGAGTDVTNGDYDAVTNVTNGECGDWCRDWRVQKEAERQNERWTVEVTAGTVSKAAILNSKGNFRGGQWCCVGSLTSWRAVVQSTYPLHRQIDWVWVAVIKAGGYKSGDWQ